MAMTFDESLVAKAREIGPLIKELAAEAEQKRRLSKPVLDALEQAGLTRMYLPKALGGLETDPNTAVRVAEELARFDASAGWLMMVANAFSFTIARLPAATVDTMLQDRNPWLNSAAVNPPGAAHEVDGGYKISARVPFASGVSNAKYMMVMALVMDGEQPRMFHGMPVMIMAFLPAKDIKVVDTWHVLGMRATDSNDVIVENVFVPKGFTCMVTPEFEPNQHFTSPLYRLPAYAAIVDFISATALGTARAAIDEVKTLSTARVPMGSMVPLRDRGTAQERFGRAEGMLRAARALLLDTMSEVWDCVKSGQPATIEHKTSLLIAATQATQTAGQVVDLMWTSGGSSAVFDKHPLQKIVRDMEVLRQHGFTCAARFETAAQLSFGLPPDFPLALL